MNNGKHTLERKLEEATSKPPVRQREVSDILDEVKDHEGMLKLFHLLKQTQEYNRLLFLHPLDLFGKEGRYQPPDLFYGNYPEKKEGESYISRALRALEINHQAKASLSLSRVFDQIGIDVKEQDTIGQDIADAIVYAFVCLFRSSPKLISLVQSDEFSYRVLRETMKDYSEVLDEERVAELLTAIFAEESSDPHLISLLERLILTFIPLLTRKPLEFIETTKISQSMYAVTYHQTALSFLENLLKKTSLSFDTYTELMNQLYLFGLIESSHTIFWCENCSRERISYYEHHGKMSPSKMHGRECRECSGQESFSSVFSVDSLLLESFFCRDNLLGVFLAWSLSDANLELQTGVRVGEREIDVLVGKTLIECKSFRLGGREDTPRENLEQTLIQIQQQIQALEQDGFTVNRAILLCNRPDVKNEMDNVRSSLRTPLDQNNFEIRGPDEVGSIVDSLKG